MAFACQNCGKGIGYGHAVSHAKNRVKRLFKPNIQKLKVKKGNQTMSVKLCTNCIQRLKKDGSIGAFRLIRYFQPEVTAKEKVEKVLEALPEAPVKKEEIKEEKEKKEKKEELKIEEIVGKA